MIKGVHALFYVKDADALRAFIRDKLRLPYTDVGEGWLIFDVSEGDVGVHPTDGDPPEGTHEMSFYCDDIEKTVAELRANGVRFTSGIEDRSYGFVTTFEMPGGMEVMLYQPRYRKRAIRPAAARRAVRRKTAAKTRRKKATSPRAR